jgi:hypothetical protein
LQNATALDGQIIFGLGHVWGSLHKNGLPVPLHGACIRHGCTL